MSTAKELMEDFNGMLATLELEAKYMRERNERLEQENIYLKTQIDALLKVLGKDKDGSET